MKNLHLVVWNKKNSNNNVSYSHHNMYQVQQKPYSKIFDTRKNVESENSNNKADSILKQHLNRIINKSEDLRINNKGTLDICNKLLLSNECKTNEKKKKTGSNNIGSNTNIHELSDNNRGQHTSYYHEQLLSESLSKNVIHSNYINDYFTLNNDNKNNTSSSSFLFT